MGWNLLAYNMDKGWALMYTIVKIDVSLHVHSFLWICGILAPQEVLPAIKLNNVFIWQCFPDFRFAASKDGIFPL